MMFRDMLTVLVISLIVYTIVMLLWKEFKVFIFNQEFAETLGFNSKFLNSMFSILIVLVIIAGIQMLGVVLLSSMIIAPAVAIRQFSNKYHNNFIIGGIISSVSGFFGSIISSVLKIPTGPSIIVLLSVVVLIAILFSPKKGLIFNKIDRLIYTRKVNKLSILYDVYKNEKVDNKTKN